MPIQKIAKAAALALALSVGPVAQAGASTPSALPNGTALEQLIPVAGGCGPNRWRGPWGGCRDTPYVGPLPGGNYQGPPRNNQYFGNGCPEGYWRGPWGHCRNTPYHGRLPDGSYK